MKHDEFKLNPTTNRSPCQKYQEEADQFSEKIRLN